MAHAAPYKRRSERACGAGFWYQCQTSDSALKRMKSGRIGIGGMGEWLKPAVLKTVSGVTRSGVRIPLPPPVSPLRPSD